MQVLNPKAIQGYASVLDYEAHILVRSMYLETRMGTTPINPAHFIGRYALKYVTICFVFLWMSESYKYDSLCSNMLTISFATRTDSTLDPLTKRVLALTKEFNELTGRFIYLLLCRPVL